MQEWDKQRATACPAGHAPPNLGAQLCHRPVLVRPLRLFAQTAAAQFERELTERKHQQRLAIGDHFSEISDRAAHGRIEAPVKRDRRRFIPHVANGVADVQSRPVQAEATPRTELLLRAVPYGAEDAPTVSGVARPAAP